MRMQHQGREGRHRFTVSVSSGGCAEVSRGVFTFAPRAMQHPNYAIASASLANPPFVAQHEARHVDASTCVVTCVLTQRQHAHTTVGFARKRERFPPSYQSASVVVASLPSAVTAKNREASSVLWVTSSFGQTRYVVGESSSSCHS